MKCRPPCFAIAFVFVWTIDLVTAMKGLKWFIVLIQNFCPFFKIYFSGHCYLFFSRSFRFSLKQTCKNHPTVLEIPSESPECRAVQSWNSIFYLFFLYGFLWNFDGGLERGGTQKGRGGGWHFNVVNIYIYTTAKFLRVPPTETRASSNSFFSCGSFARCFATSLLIIFECSCHAHASCRWCREECGARFCYWPWSFAFIYLPVRFFF